MGLAEDGVVDFLAGTVEHGDVVVGVLGTAVTLDGLVAGVAEDVELLEEVGLHDVVGVEHDDVVEVISHHLNGILHGLRLGTLLKDGRQQRDGLFAQKVVGLVGHVVGDDNDLEAVVWILLIEELVDGVQDDAVLVVGGIEDEEAALAVVERGGVLGGEVVFLVEQRDEGEEYYIGNRATDDKPQ